MALEARPLAPSGTQIELAYGDQRAVVTSVGAGLRAYTTGSRDVVAGYAADEMSPGGRGQLLIPSRTACRAAATSSAAAATSSR